MHRVPPNARDRERWSAQPLGAKCEKCPFAVDGKPPHVPVYGTGPVTAEGIVVAESPGEEEVKLGRPLVGPTGKGFDDELLEAGLKRSKLFLLNAILCRPPRSKSEGDMRKACDACRPAFLKQLELYADDIPVIAMGRYAHYALRGVEKGVGSERGFVRSEFKLPRLDK